MTGPQFDERRHFTPTETTFAWLRQGGVCPMCQRELPRDLFDGDHVIPYSRGGLTTLDNLQALCRACNARKGNRSTPRQLATPVSVELSAAPLRHWVVEALAVVESNTRPLLIEACPGAGKTRFALEAAARMFSSGEINRVLIVVPSRRLVVQWIEAASGVGGGASLPLAPATWRHSQPLPLGAFGGVITYQALFSQPMWWAAFAAEHDYRTLVIFDEIHHAGTESGWGIASQEAFSRWATRILCLTGTAFRTRDPMAFVRTVEVGPLERRSVADYTYGYGDALRDGVCRPVFFEHVGGTATFQVPDGNVYTVSTDEELNERGDSYRLRTLLEPNGGHLTQMIEVANAHLARLRATGDDDAAGLVVCIDCDHADAVAQVLTQRIGVRPTFVCSRFNDPDDPAPADALETFTDGNAPWIIAVKMVSEGVDIPRLRVLVYATNVLTELAFRQIIGRVVRTDKQNDQDYGVIVLPVDEQLDAMADRITREAPVGLAIPIVVSDPTWAGTPIAPTAPRGSFAPIASTGALEYVTSSDGRRAPVELLVLAERYIEQTQSAVPPFEIAIAAYNDPDIEAQLRARTTR